MPNLNSINLSLSSVFYLIPLYFLIIAPVLRQFFPSYPALSAPRDIRDAAYFDYEGKGGELEEEDTSLQLNSDLLSLEDGVTVVCELGSDTYRTHIFSYNPLVVYIEGFLSAREADHLINVRYHASTFPFTILP
jgi:prolyl 4-hydroxylase